MLTYTSSASGFVQLRSYTKCDLSIMAQKCLTDWCRLMKTAMSYSFAAQVFPIQLDYRDSTGLPEVFLRPLARALTLLRRQLLRRNGLMWPLICSKEESEIARWSAKRFR